VHRHAHCGPCCSQAQGTAKQPGAPFGSDQDGKAGRVDVADQREVQDEPTGGGAQQAQKLLAYSRRARYRAGR
jgi:hypothetical protein